MAPSPDAPSPDPSPSDESPENAPDAQDSPRVGRSASEQARLEVEILREALGIDDSSPGGASTEDASENEPDTPP